MLAVNQPSSTQTATKPQSPSFANVLAGSSNSNGGDSPTAKLAAKPSTMPAPSTGTGSGDIPAQASNLMKPVINGTVAPSLGVDFSALDTERLTEQSLAGAREIGRSLTEDGGKALASRGQARIAGVRTQLKADGATGEQLTEFDNAISNIASLRAFQAIGDDRANSTSLTQSRNSVQSGSLAIFVATEQTRQERLDGLASPVTEGSTPGGEPTSSPVESAINQTVDQALSGDAPSVGTQDLSTLSTERLRIITSNAVEQIGQFAGDGDRASTVQTATNTIAAVRQEIVADGASPAALEQFDTAIRDMAVGYAPNRERDPVTNELDPERDLEQSARGSASLNDFFEGHSATRLNRLEPLPPLDAAVSKRLAEGLDGAFADDGSTPLSTGNARLGDTVELANTTIAVGASLAEGIVRSNDQQVSTAQTDFGAIRQALSDQGATPEEIGEIEDRFAVMVNEQARAQQGDLSTIRRTGKNTSDFRQLIDIALSGDPLERDGDGNAIGDNLRLKDMREFEGTNGAAPVSIVVLESRSGNSTRHSAAVENVIESQLQEAGQGYKMTNLENFDRLDVALAEIAQIAPDYANFSLGNEISPEFLSKGLQSLSDAGNDVVAGLDLTDGVTVENIGDFADAIRTIALDFDAYKSDIDDSTSLHPEWVRIGAEIRGFENLAAAGTNVFASVPNSATEFSSNQFAKDDGLEGTITNVGNVPSSNALTSDQLWSPDGAVPDSNTSNSQVYRGPLVDVYASGMAPAGLNGSANGTSFASPEVLVQTVLGRFDAKTEKIIAAE